MHGYSFILLLLKGKKVVNQCQKQGQTPLHIATENGRTSVIEVLLSHGGDINLKTPEGLCCLHLAAKLCNKNTDIEVEMTPSLSQVFMMVGINLCLTQSTFTVRFWLNKQSKCQVDTMAVYTTAKKKRPNQLGYLVGIWL